MNFYIHHIGDYAQATQHLSFVEDATYIRMIRKYYADEKSLPAEIKAVQRLVGARTNEEKRAVETVLNEFFVLQADGWHNSRCDKDLAAYHEKQEKAKRSAEARWSASITQCELDPDGMPMECERIADAVPTQSEGNANQEPVNQEPVTSKKKKQSLGAPATRLPADWQPSDDDLQFCRTERPDLNPVAIAYRFRDYWLAAPGLKGRKQDWPATWRNWVRNEKQVQTFGGKSVSQSRAETVAFLTGKTPQSLQSAPVVPLVTGNIFDGEARNVG
jgi:uncharacterized protein YdaU (DUF1376 family)